MACHSASQDGHLTPCLNHVVVLGFYYESKVLWYGFFKSVSGLQIPSFLPMFWKMARINLIHCNIYKILSTSEYQT